MSSSSGQYGRDRRDTQQGPGTERNSETGLQLTIRLPATLPRNISPEEAYRVLELAYAVIRQVEDHVEHEKFTANSQGRVAAQEQAVENATQMLTQYRNAEIQRAAECVQATAALQAASDACRKTVDDVDATLDNVAVAERTLIRATDSRNRAEDSRERAQDRTL